MSMGQKNSALIGLWVILNGAQGFLLALCSISTSEGS